MSTSAIREDVESQISLFVGLLHEAFDPDRYPRLEDGPEFDRRFAELEERFAALERLFQDYLTASWSTEISSRFMGQRAIERQ